jgi:hypothetical protein
MSIAVKVGKFTFSDFLTVFKKGSCKVLLPFFDLKNDATKFQLFVLPLSPKNVLL